MASEPHAVNEDTSFVGHPWGLATLFFTEMWERFSYYGTRAILLLFMTAPILAATDEKGEAVRHGGLQLDASTAAMIMGIYGSLLYLASLPGGWFADNFLGQRLAVLIGGLTIAAGNALLCIYGLQFLIGGITLIIIGGGLLKPNISTMVGQLYKPGDRRRDAGFTIFYMGINIGAMIAPLVCGFFAQSETMRGLLAGWGFDPGVAWRLGFGAAAAGMCFGLLQYVIGWSNLSNIGLPPTDLSPETQKRNRTTLVLGIVVLVAVVGLMSSIGYLTHGKLLDLYKMTLTEETQPTAQVTQDGYILVSNPAPVAPKSERPWYIQEGGLSLVNSIIGLTLLGIPFVYFFVLFVFRGPWTPDETGRLLVIVSLFLSSIVFWAAFEQAQSTLTIFADTYTILKVSETFSIPSAWFQSINAFCIVVFAPLFAIMWIRLGKHDPSTPMKFTLALVILSIAFGVMSIGSRFLGPVDRVSALWLVGCYFFCTLAELCLSPVGLSAITKLAPQRVASEMMGIWFLSSSLAIYLCNQALVVMESLREKQGLTGPEAATFIFDVTAISALVAGVLMLVCTPVLRSWMGTAR